MNDNELRGRDGLIARAIEAGAKAWFDRGQRGRRDQGRWKTEGQLWQWDDNTEDAKRAYRALVEPTVRAAAEETLRAK